MNVTKESREQSRRRAMERIEMLTLSNRVRAAGITALLLFATGCPLDERTLHEVEQGGSGGNGNDSGTTGSEQSAISASNTESSTDSSSGGSDSSGGSGGSDSSGGSGGSDSSGGSSASGGGGSALGCSDLDENGVPDCEETLAKNSRFDTDVSNWEPEQTAKIEWQSVTAGEEDDTGCIGVANIVESTLPDALVLTGAYQCLRIRENQRYLVQAQMFVPSPQQDVSGAIGALFFDSNNCSGRPLLAATSRLNPSQGSWRALNLDATAPEEANSMKVRLATVKMGTNPAAEVSFDNVLVREY